MPTSVFLCFNPGENDIDISQKCVLIKNVRLFLLLYLHILKWWVACSSVDSRPQGLDRLLQLLISFPRLTLNDHAEFGFWAQLWATLGIQAEIRQVPTLRDPGIWSECASTLGGHKDKRGDRRGAVAQSPGPEEARVRLGWKGGLAAAWVPSCPCSENGAW